MSLSAADFGDHFTRWDTLFQSSCGPVCVPWSWMKALAMIESSLGLDPRVKHGIENPEDIEFSRSEDGKSWGLLQLEPRAARDFDLIATPEKLNHPDYSIQVGSQLLRRLYRALGGEEEFVIKGWNEGQGNAVLEKAGRIPGKSSEYWEKYKEHKAILV